MDELISEEELEMEAPIPEPEHIETIIEGMSDSLGAVAGVESLTNAQIYLGSVLAANGYIRRNQVGQEGFMSKVGDGFKAAIAYIKKVFANIWDFFFKRDAPKMVEEAKAEIKEAQEVLKVIETGGSNEKETTLALTNMRKVAMALSHQPDVNKAALDQILKEADDAMKGDQAKKKAAVLSIGRELPKLNKRSSEAIRRRIDDVIRTLTNTDKVVGEIIDKGDTPDAHEAVKGMGAAIKSARPELEETLAKFKKASGDATVANLKDCYTYTLQNMEATQVAYSKLEGEKSAVQAEIKRLESSDGDKTAVEALKSILGSVSSLINVSKDMIGAGKGLLKAGKKSFGY